MQKHVYTLFDFLDENFIPGIRLLTKEQDFRNIVIEQISVQELPAQTFIHNNELVLTTAVGCRNEESLLVLIEEMSHAAAVFLTFQDETFSIPVPVITFANERGLPLFLIPWECRFSEIQAYIIRRVQEKQLEVFQNLQTALFNLFFETKPLQEAINHIGNTLRYPISIVDKNRRFLGISDNAHGLVENPSVVTEIPISINKRPCGYLVLQSFDHQESIIDQAIVERYICFPLSLWFNRKDTEDMLAMKLKNDFVLNLANSNYESFDDMVVHGRHLQFNLTKPYTCIILKAVTNLDITKESRDSSEFAINTTAIETYLIAEGKQSKLGIMVAAQSLEFIIYVENLAEEPDIKIDSLVDTLEKNLKELFPVYSFYWGVSEISLKPPDFGRLYKNASLALQHCLNSKSKRYRCSYQDTKEAQIISVLARDREIQRIVQNTVGTLQHYDVNSEIDLMGTLMEFVKCNFNISKTARKLHIHRQSLLYRLQKIEELTETSLDNHQDLFLLEVCVRILIGDNHY